MEPERRRRRPAVSCVLCRRRKIRCDRGTPCANCAKSKNATCVYRDDPRAPRRQGPFGDTGDAPLLPLTPSTAGSSAEQDPSHPEPSRPPTTALTTSTAGTVRGRSPGSHVRPARSRTAPEPAVSAATSSANTPVSTFTRNCRVETKALCVSGNFYFHSEHRLAGQPQAITRSVSHKTRLFGQSHWVTTLGMLSDLFEILERYLRDDAGSKTLSIEKRTKALGRIIKSRRAPPWPCAPTPELPARALTDALVERYLSTSETVLRVLHIPSFRRDYEAVWDSSKSPDPAFLVQLKLVLAIGATTYDAAFSLRSYAMRWVYEGQTWLSAPEFKSRLGIPSLQSSILLLLAREASGVGEDMVWATIGTTLRIAMYMGLHRDPASFGPGTTTPLVAEMRRRLWNSILELAMQSSLNSGGPPLINVDEFDTEPPGNFDDDQLTDYEGEAPIPRPIDQYTQTTVAIALRNMFPQRLAIVKCLNDISYRGTYADTLRLDAELREAYKTLTRTLQACKTPVNGPTDLELRCIDLILRRYFLVLHLPFFAPSLQDTAFAFSRRVVVESALRVWRAAFSLPLSLSADATTEWDSLQLIATSGSGFFRTVAVQGFVAIAIELKSLIREEEGFGLGPVELRPDLQVALQDFKVWSWKCIQAGQTNTRGYLVACMVLAQVEAVRRGMNDEETEAHVVKAAEAAQEQSLGLLEQIELASREPQEAVPGGVGVDGAGGALGVSPDFGVEDWEYMISNTLFNSSSQDPLSWVFQY